MKKVNNNLLRIISKSRFKFVRYTSVVWKFVNQIKIKYEFSMAFIVNTRRNKSRHRSLL